MENRSMVKMVYMAVMANLAKNNTIKGSTSGANEYQSKNYSGSIRKRSSRPKRLFHRQKR